MEDAGNWRFMSLGIVCGIVKVSSRASGVAGQHLTPPVLTEIAAARSTFWCQAQALNARSYKAPDWSDTSISAI